MRIRFVLQDISFEPVETDTFTDIWVNKQPVYDSRLLESFYYLEDDRNSYAEDHYLKEENLPIDQKFGKCLATGRGFCV